MKRWTPALCLLLALPLLAARAPRACAQIDLILTPEPMLAPVPTPTPANDPNETRPPAPAGPLPAVAAPAAIDGTVPLFEAADEDSRVLMEYYAGARLSALRPVGDGLWRVQAGVKGASVIGYMREGDLRFGAEAQRHVRPAYMELEFNREAPVYAYPDTASPVIGRCVPEKVYYAMSRTDDKWVQLFLPPVEHGREQEDRMTCGFVYMVTGLGRGYWNEMNEWTVDALPGELTDEAIRIRAAACLRERLIDGADDSFSPHWSDPKAILSCAFGQNARVMVICVSYRNEEPAVACYRAYFWAEEQDDQLVYSLYLPQGENEERVTELIDWRSYHSGWI